MTNGQQNNKRTLILSIVLTMLYNLVWFIIYELGNVDLGMHLYDFLNFVLGLSVGALPGKKQIVTGVVLGLAMFLMLLLVLQFEGLEGVLITLPIVIMAIAFGAMVSSKIAKLL